MLGNLSAFFKSADFQKTFFKNYFSNTIRVSNGLDPVQDRHSVHPDLGQNRLQRLSVDDKIRHWHARVETMKMRIHFIYFFDN